jgi:hypothetical protein
MSLPNGGVEASVEAGTGSGRGDKAKTKKKQ